MRDHGQAENHGRRRDEIFRVRPDDRSNGADCDGGGKPFICISKPNAAPITLTLMPYLVKILGLENELAQALTPDEPKARRCRP
jgi:hypothetical protein